MNVSDVVIENFLTIGKASFNLDARGVLLVQGENKDDPSAKSNGAGKSSIGDGVYWCLFGKTARGITGDAVVNDTAGKDCRVQVTLVEGATSYLITRHRKHHTGKNSLTVETWVGTLTRTTPITKGTDKETQELVEKILGCGEDVFSAGIYAGQERMPDLPGMTDKELKLLIEEASGATILAEAYTHAQKAVLTSEKELALAVSNYRVAGTALVTVNGTLKRDSELRDDFETHRRTRATAELMKIPPLTASISATVAKLAGFDKFAHENGLRIAKAAQDSFAPRSEELEKLRAIRRTNEALAHVASARYNAQADDVAACRKKIANINSTVGKPCGSCGKPHEAADVETLLELANIKLKHSLEKADLLYAEYKELAAKAETSDRAFTECLAKMPDLSKLAGKVRDLNEALMDAQELETEAAQYKTKIDELKVKAKEFLEQKNPYAAMVETTAFRQKSLTIEHTETALKMAECELAVVTAKDVAQVFGPAGVRAHMLDEVTPLLNEQTKEYLGALSDGNIHATWTTLRKTAKGELKEQFTIDVVNTKGAKTFDGLSGGEKRKVRLACFMALQDLVASRATKPINLFIADEIDHALDEPALERLMGILERKAKERGTVVVISHNSLASWITEVITVTKVGGVSTISGATGEAGTW